VPSTHRLALACASLALGVAISCSNEQALAPLQGLDAGALDVPMTSSMPEVAAAPEVGETPVTDAESATGLINVLCLLPLDATFPELTFVLSSSSTGDTIRSGHLSGPAPDETATIELSAPAGEHLVITLAGTTSDGTACEGESPPFFVLRDSMVNVAISVVCGNAGSGYSGPPAR
jgi:hypothetical protein